MELLPGTMRPVWTTPAQYVSLSLQHDGHVPQVSMMGFIPARSPTLKFLTFAPALTTTPAPSWPGEQTPKVDIDMPRSLLVGSATRTRGPT